MDDSALADLELKSRFTRARQWVRNFPPFSVYNSLPCKDSPTPKLTGKRSANSLQIHFRFTS
ncbi:hypothetical protein ACN38_g12154, partial [Penicillium nordicum]